MVENGKKVKKVIILTGAVPIEAVVVPVLYVLLTQSEL
jgi:hypothetical protein